MTAWWSWVLAAVGVAGMWLTGRQVGWGWLVGLAAQVLWFVYGVASEQYGFAVSALVFGCVQGNNAWLWRKEQRRDSAATTEGENGG